MWTWTMQISEDLPLRIACFGILKTLQYIALEAKGKKKKKVLEVYLNQIALNFYEVPSPTLLIQYLHCGTLCVIWILKYNFFLLISLLSFFLRSWRPRVEFRLSKSVTCTYQARFEHSWRHPKKLVSVHLWGAMLGPACTLQTGHIVQELWWYLCWRDPYRQISTVFWFFSFLL